MDVKEGDVVLCTFYFSDLKSNKKRPVLVFKDNLPDIIEFFKEDGKGYQSKINNVLRSYVEAHPTNSNISLRRISDLHAKKERWLD